MRRLLAWAGLSLCAGCFAAEAKTPRPSDLVPIVVAAVDIPTGTVVTFDMISQRSVTAAYVTSSIVKPDSASYIVNQRIELPALAGDALLWSMFGTTSDKASAEACRRVLPQAAATAREQVAQARDAALGASPLRAKP